MVEQKARALLLYGQSQDSEQDERDCHRYASLTFSPYPPKAVKGMCHHIEAVFYLFQACLYLFAIKHLTSPTHLLNLSVQRTPTTATINSINTSIAVPKLDSISSLR